LNHEKTAHDFGGEKGSIAKEVSHEKSESEEMGNPVVPIWSGNIDPWVIEFCGLGATVFAGQSQLTAWFPGVYM